jgi:hypothetical protein
MTTMSLVPPGYTSCGRIIIERLRWIYEQRTCFRLSLIAAYQRKYAVSLEMEVKRCRVHVTRQLDVNAESRRYAVTAHHGQPPPFMKILIGKL